MKKLLVVVAMMLTVLNLGGSVNANDKADNVQLNSGITTTTVKCKNGTFEALKNNTNHVINYEFIGPINCGGVDVLSKGTYHIYPGQTYMTNKRVVFSY